jgi:4-nitrophenyl phosphatase
LKKLLIFDLDGVIYGGGERVAYAAEGIAAMSALGIAIRFLTNNSTRSRAFYRDKLRLMGVPCESEDIMSSALATRIYLEERSPNGARVYIVGERGIADELADFFTILGPRDRKTADYVVVGMDREFNYEKLTCATDALTAGAELIATNRDATYPMPNGYLLPGGGTIVAALAEFWGRQPYVAGKPNPLGIHHMIKTAGVNPGDVLLIGDRPSADMVTGRRAGVDTCLVLTGVTAPGEVPGLAGELKPDYVVENLIGLAALGCISGAPATNTAKENEAQRAS